jgi:hypothetical protein
MTSVTIPREQTPPAAVLLKSVDRRTVRADVRAEVAELAGRVQRLAERATPEQLELLRACLEFSEGTIRDNGPDISVSIPVRLLPAMVLFGRFLSTESTNGVALTRLILNAD